MTMMFEITFWLLLVTILYVFVGYPLLLELATLFYHRKKHIDDIQPRVTITMAARNEINNIASKLDSCLKLNYPKEMLEIIVGSDGSTDGTVGFLKKKYAHQGIRILDLPRMGKAMVNNRMVEEATGEIIIDTTSSGYFEPDFVRFVVRHFADPEVGCVTGESYFGNVDASTTSGAEGVYFGYEWKLRKLESDLGLLCVGNGGVLAWRETLYSPIDPASDVDNMVPLQTVMKGYLVIHESVARTLGETAVDTSKRQLRGRIRQVTRSQQDIFRAGVLLNPFRSPKYAFVLYSRRLLRWWTPFLLMGVFISNLQLIQSHFYLILFIGQCFCYLLGIVGLIKPQILRQYSKILTLPSSVINVGCAFLLGTVNAARGKQIVKW